MDKSNKEFDKFIRGKISGIEFTKEKDSWELLSYMLKQRARIRQRTRVVKLLFSLLLIVSGALVVFMPPSHNKNNTGIRDKTLNAPANSPPENFAAKKNNTQRYRNENISQPSDQENKNAVSVVSNRPVNTMDENAAGESFSEASVEKTTTEENPPVIDFYSAMNSYAWGSDSFKIEITNAGNGVNSSYSDFAPVISADGSTMFFTSRRPVTGKQIKQRKQAMEHVYYCLLNDRNKWVNASIISQTINADGRNNSVIWFSGDGQRMLLYRDDIHGNGDIYESTLKGTEWTLPALMDEPVNTKYHESSAGISPDGKTLYFVSDRPGGIGGRDIWYCTRAEDGKWTNVTNFGLPVNSPKDEEGIFIHPDGTTIYFSSKGHDGFGGYDVYRTVLKNGRWSAPVNLGTPLNTTGDDIYFVMDVRGTTAYYTSSRPGGNGEKDIYKITFQWTADNAGGRKMNRRPEFKMPVH